MRKLIAFVIAVPMALFGQEGAPPQKVPMPSQQSGQKPEPSKPEEAKPAEGAKAEQPPAPAAEKWLTGEVDFGNRWLLNRQGDVNTYRSVVNLGEGPKLFAANLTLNNLGKSKWFDRIDFRMNSWGGEPYNTAAVDARREGLYRFTFNYRNIAYYNFLPSFADPLRESRGIFLDERSFDQFFRMSDFQLDLFPGRRIIPYVAYSRNGQRGSGISTLVLSSNEYPVNNRISNRADNYRGGVRFEFNRWHVTLEQGAINFADDETTFWNPNGGPNFGNLAGSPFLGNTLTLAQGDQAYHIRSDAKYTRGLFTANPFSWLDVYGQFLYSQIHSTSDFSQRNQGTFFNLATFGFYSSQFQTLAAQAKQPHPGGSVGVVLRPFRRFRVFESYMTDRLHNVGTALLANTILTGGVPTTSQVRDFDRVVMTYNRQELNLLYDLSNNITLRGGWKYEWGDVSAPAALVIESLGTETAKLKRHVGLAGVNFRWRQKVTANLDYEGSPGDRAYFRTSVNEYQRARMRARWQALPSLSFGAVFVVFRNQNPNPDIKYDYLMRDNSVNVNWTPGGGKRFSFLADYSRSTLHSDILYRIPQTFGIDTSRYRDNAHTATSLVDIGLPGAKSVQPKLTFGGSLFKSSGSRPTQYYQPMGRFSLPLGEHVRWYAEWRWYAMSQDFAFYRFEGFRSNQFVTGFRLMM